MRNISKTFKRTSSGVGIEEGIGIIQFVPIVVFRSGNRMIYSTDKVDLTIIYRHKGSSQLEFSQVSNNEVRIATIYEKYLAIRSFYVDILFTHSWGRNSTIYNLWENQEID